VDHKDPARNLFRRRSGLQRPARARGAGLCVLHHAPSDPNLKRGGDPALTNLIEGARRVVDAAQKAGKLDYDVGIEGLQAIDRHTLRIKLTTVDYTVLERLADLGSFAVAREAVQAAGAEVVSKPMGTGPFRLQEWTRGSRVILDANPHYRSIGFPESDDPG
jgi:ABC-type transport system substrate-binding protein